MTDFRGSKRSFGAYEKPKKAQPRQARDPQYTVNVDEDEPYGGLHVEQMPRRSLVEEVPYREVNTWGEVLPLDLPPADDAYDPTDVITLTEDEDDAETT